MKLAAFIFLHRWLCEHLVRALLGGAWRFVLDREGAAQDSAFSRFNHLVNAAPLWPCFVEFIHPRENLARAMRGLPCCQSLLILSDRQAVDDHLEWDNWEDSFR